MTTRRRNIMLGTAGHVDHGKTALVKLLTGCNTDTLAEERTRGLTIDLGFAPCRLPDQRVVGIVDVPGHADFLRNMVAGAHGIDVVMLVVAADDGIMPQTREHLNILTLMGLKHGLVALTKTDLVEPAWREVVVEELRQLLRGTFLASAPICPLSNLTGEGFDAFFDALDTAVSSCADRSCDGLFRVWVADVFSARGFGTIVTGIPSNGRVRPGDHLSLVPGPAHGRVRRLEVYGEDAPEGRAGECVAMNLPDLDHHVVRRGMVLTEADTITAASMIEVSLHLLPGTVGRLKDYAEVHVHLGTTSALAHVALLESGEMVGGSSQMAQLRLAEPVGAVPGERFVIRATLPGSGLTGLTTVGGGRVLGVSNVRLRRRRSWTIAALSARQAVLDDAAPWCALVLRESRSPLPLDLWARQCLRRPAELEQVARTLRTEEVIQQAANGAYVHRETITAATDKIRAALQAFHAAEPQRLGVEMADLAVKLGLDQSVFDLAVEALLARRELQRQGALLALAGRQVRLSADDEEIASKVADALARGRWTAPGFEDLTAALHLPRPPVEAAIKRLIEGGLAVRITDDFVVHRTALDAAKQVVLRLFATAPSFSTMDFRDALGVSRKYAVPLLDYLDRVRFTVRQGHTRTPGVEAKRLLP
jgi:selenocysteine-specific elongation factor